MVESNDDYDDDFPEEELSLKDVYQRGVSTLTETFVLVAALTLIGEVFCFGANLLRFGLFVFLANLLVQVSQGAVALTVYREYHGERLDILEAYLATLGRLPAIILTSILKGLVLAVILIPAAFLISSFQNKTGGALTFFGLIVLGVFAAYVYSHLGLAIPIAAIEGMGAVNSLRRSSLLTKGYRLKTMVVYTLLGFSILILSYLGLVFISKIIDNAAISSLTFFKTPIKPNFIKIANIAGIKGLFIVSLTGYIVQLIWNVFNSSLYLEILIAKQDNQMEDMVQVFE
ncbi:MAG: hypothetical protein LBI10_11735 [Deltaproteobacteria bacterium]|jgi:preprotein translocase subunit Sss1|nr:hypothetical protein [Deltaproteobacteria bacterium]